MPTIDGKHLPYTKANISKAKKAKKSGHKVNINMSDVVKKYFK